jgi:hypothetical protein
MLAKQGYHCVSIGKMHINPYDASGGFHQRFVVENKDRPLFLEERDRAIYDEWDKALHVRGLERPSRYNRFASDPECYRQALGPFTCHLDADIYLLVLCRRPAGHLTLTEAVQLRGRAKHAVELADVAIVHKVEVQLHRFGQLLRRGFGWRSLFECWGSLHAISSR